MNKRILSILVENTSGVLSRISGLFSRRGYNIDSLSVGVTINPNYSRMTIICHGKEIILEQIIKQVQKLEDVLTLKILDEKYSVNRELILIKIAIKYNQIFNIFYITNIFRANIIDINKESIIIEIIGTKSKLDAFIDLFNNYEIIESARTGITGLSRGIDNVFCLKNNDML